MTSAPDLSDLPRLMRQSEPPRAGIVHLGPGAFFKAFNACFTDEAMQAAGGDWGMVAVSLKSDKAQRELEPQGCAYTSVSLDADGDELRVIEAISDVLVLPQDPQKVLDAMVDPRIKIVSLTITEKGYCHTPATGGLDLSADDIQHDLDYPSNPRTAPGLIVEALARRRAAGVRPFTILSCDNLPANGQTARQVVLDFARARNLELSEWIAAEGRFPSTMVDRITPATTQEDVARLAVKTGVYDPACVQHEAFRQWVIEDDFVDGARPGWDTAGAQLVSSVHAHETMKLRCLNGTHSSLAYLGYLAGFETIAETVSDEGFGRFCQHLWSMEILPVVTCPEGEDLNRYTQALFDRYQNPAIRHRCWQIAMDGSQKLPQRLLGTVQDNLKQGQVPQGLCLSVAAWMRYVGGTDETGQPIDVRDPLAQKLRAKVQAAGGAAGAVASLLEVSAVFDPDLAADDRFREAVTAHYERLLTKGARVCVADLVNATATG